MIIGYGFQDEHINQAIQNGIKNGLKIFVIAPEGPELAITKNESRNKAIIQCETNLEIMFKEALIGASRISIRETFNSKQNAEFKKVIRFFDD